MCNNGGCRCPVRKVDHLRIPAPLIGRTVGRIDGIVVVPILIDDNVDCFVFIIADRVVAPAGACLLSSVI